MKPEAAPAPETTREEIPDAATIQKWIDVLVEPQTRSKRTAALIACICTLDELPPADQRAVAETLTAFYVFNAAPPAAADRLAAAMAAEEGFMTDEIPAVCQVCRKRLTRCECTETRPVEMEARTR